VDDRPGLGAFVGDVHARILQALGCVAYATNGSMRNLDEVHGFGFQFFAFGVAISHAFAHIVDFGQSVEVAGLTVSTGDVLFGDADGLLSLPPSIVGEIPERVGRMREREEQVKAFCRSSGFSIAGLRDLVRDLG